MMAALGTVLLPTLALASGGDGTAHAPPPAWTTIFFALMLLGIAIIPLSPLEHWWHKNTNKLIYGLALAAYPMVHLLVISPNSHLLLETMHEYFSFIVLLGTLGQPNTPTIGVGFGLQDAAGEVVVIELPAGVGWPDQFLAGCCQALQRLLDGRQAIRQPGGGFQLR